MMWVIFAIIVLVVVASFWKIASSREWEPVQGKILVSSVETLDQGQSNVRITESQFYYKFSVKFQYEVEGESYVGDRVFASMPNIFRDKNEITSFAEKYKTGDLVTVYYNTNNIEESALIAGKDIFSIKLILVLGMLVAVAALLVGAGIYFFRNF